MDVLFLIIVRIILPVFSLIGMGLVLHRKFKFDINTLSSNDLFSDAGCKLFKCF
jgi:malate permease and related proteins